MNQEECKYYKFGLSANTYLSINKGLYSQSEELINGIIRVIECNIEEKWMKLKERSNDTAKWTLMNLDEIRKYDIVDLSDQGDRWEGDSLDGLPFGYGYIYNSNNQLVYMGFIFEGKKVCFGTELYGDVNMIEYEGTFYNNIRYGKGKLYNKKNELIYDGEWVNNNPLNERKVVIHNKLKNEDIHFGIEEIKIEENCLDSLENFQLSSFYNLKKLRIKKNCLKKLLCFCIQECNQLVNVSLIGKEMTDDERDDFINQNNNGISDEESTTRIFQINDCESLEQISAGYYWFKNCNTLRLFSIFLL